MEPKEYGDEEFIYAMVLLAEEEANAENSEKQEQRGVDE